jgi:propionyl-CoA synthetase
MAAEPPDAAWRKLGAEPGLCAACQHAKLNETRRGTAYLRCMRAAWDSRLPRYPRLPVAQCVGFDPLSAGDGRPGHDVDLPCEQVPQEPA